MHTRRSSANGMNHTCLCLRSRPRRDMRLSWPWVAGWLHTEINAGVPEPGRLCPRCPCCTRAHGRGQRNALFCKTIIIAFASKQCDTQTTNRRGDGERGGQGVCGNQRTAKNILWTYSLSNWLSVIDEHLMFTSLYVHLYLSYITVTAVSSSSV